MTRIGDSPLDAEVAVGSLAEPTAPPPFGDSDLAALTRALDRAAAPLGPIERRPQSLRTVVDTMLSLTAESTPGAGSTLTLTLPRADPPRHEARRDPAEDA